MVNKDRHPTFACPDPAPSVSPRAWGFLLWNAGGDCGLVGSLSPRTTGTQRNAPGRQGFKFLRDAGRPARSRAAGRLLASMCRTSSKIPPVLSSFPSLFRLQGWTELNHSSAGGRRRLGGSCHAWGDARPDRSLASGDCDARFARARYGYQSHTMRALRAVAYLTNALQVRTLVAGEQLGCRATTRDVERRTLREGASDIPLQSPT